jgi:protein-tyrosine phosphatase
VVILSQAINRKKKPQNKTRSIVWCEEQHRNKKKKKRETPIKMSSPSDPEEPLLRENDQQDHHDGAASINQGPEDCEASPQALRSNTATIAHQGQNGRSGDNTDDEGQPSTISIPIPSSSHEDHQGVATSAHQQQQQQQRIGTRVRSDTLLANILAKEINPLNVEGSSGAVGEGSARRRNLNSPLGFLYQLFKSLPMQIVMVLLTFVDISFLLYEFITGDVQYAIVTLCTSLMFVLEVLVLWSFLGTTEYFQNDKKWVIAEVLIVTISFLIEYTEYIIESVVPSRDFAGDLRYLRAARFLRAVIIWKTRYRNFTAALRQLVSADRRRYVKDGYDLDLTYVHPKVIAMSWPSSNSEALYRNQIDNVAAFLDEKHPQHYRVYNLCSERSYDESKFHFQCSRYRIDDHSPPEVHVMLMFAKDVHGFIQRDPRRNVAVIHCKGGKGRTGTMVCTYLLYAGVKDTAASALGHFGLLRTSDEAKSFQGVESPAQERYVQYFERLLKLPNGPESLPVVRAKFTRFTLHGVPFAWWSAGLDRLWFAMIASPSTLRNVIYKSNPTINFDGQLPADPFKKRKTKLGARKGAQLLQSPRASMSPQEGESSPRPSIHEDDDDDARPDNVYSDADEPASVQVFGNNNGGATQQSFSPDAVEGGGSCQPFSSNMTIMVNGNIADPMDFDSFEERFVLAGGAESSNTTAAAAKSSRYLSPSNHGGASPAIGGSSRMFRGGEGGSSSPSRSVRRNVDKSLNVSVSFDVTEMPVFEKDLNIRFFFNQDDPNTLQCNLQTFFHTAFEDSNFLRLGKCQLDGPHKEANKEKKFPKNIELDLQWERVGA